MKTIKIAFYKNSKTLFGKLIRIKQNLQGYSGRYAQYSHTELVFEDGQFFSSSEVDGGVRFKDIKPKKKNWDFITLQIPAYKYYKIVSFAKSQEGNKYDWTGIFFSQILNINLQNKDSFFCSEITCIGLQQASLLCGVSANFVNPARLAKLLEDKGFKINN